MGNEGSVKLLKGRLKEHNRRLLVKKDDAGPEECHMQIRGELQQSAMPPVACLGCRMSIGGTVKWTPSGERDVCMSNGFIYCRAHLDAEVSMLFPRGVDTRRKSMGNLDV